MEGDASASAPASASSLKIRYNSVFGFYLEISKANLHLVPDNFERKQTLANAERFTTPELKEYETKVLAADERIAEIERRLRGNALLGSAAIATPSPHRRRRWRNSTCYSQISRVAAARNYTRPDIHRRGRNRRSSGGPSPRNRATPREQQGERFVPNPVYLNEHHAPDSADHRP